MEGVLGRKVNGLEYTFYSRVLVQLVLVIYLMIQSDQLLVQCLFVLIMLLFIVTNVQLYNQTIIEHRFVRKLLIAEAIILLMVFPFVPYAPYYIFYLVLLVTAILLMGKNVEMLLFSLFFILLPIIHYFYQGHTEWRSLMSYGLLVLFFSFFSHAIRRMEEQQEELQLLNEQLKEYVEKDQELAVVKERVRIARDIHDTVAHKATGLIIQLQKLQYVHRQKTVAETESIIAELLLVARSMLDEMRQSVRSMAPTNDIELSAFNVFTRMIHDFQKTTSIKIDYGGLGVLEHLSPERKTLIYRILQEAFTNAKRHGFATYINVQCTMLEHQKIKIVIQDNGRGMDLLQEKGFGLTNMQARLNEVGGTLSIQNQEEKGCILTCMLPSKGDQDYD